MRRTGSGGLGPNYGKARGCPHVNVMPQLFSYVLSFLYRLYQSDLYSPFFISSHSLIFGVCVFDSDIPSYDAMVLCSHPQTSLHASRFLFDSIEGSKNQGKKTGNRMTLNTSNISAYIRQFISSIPDVLPTPSITFFFRTVADHQARRGGVCRYA